MALTKSTVAVNNISSLSATPNATEGLTAAQLQAKFDKSASDNKTYINDTLTTEIDALFTTSASGWTVLPATLTYASATTMNTSADLTGVIGVGDKIKLTQTSAKYFIVTVITANLITVYGGTDYTVESATITTPYYSKVKTPFGFPMDPDKWTITISNSNNLFTTPTSGVWWNPGSISIAIPIGSWRISYKVVGRGATSGESTYLLYSTTLSTTNNSETLTNFTLSVGNDISATSQTRYGTMFVSNIYTTTTAKTLYLLSSTLASDSLGNSNGFNGAASPTLITATCAYL